MDDRSRAKVVQADLDCASPSDVTAITVHVDMVSSLQVFSCGLCVRSGYEMSRKLMEPSGALGFAVNRLEEFMYEAGLFDLFIILQHILDSLNSGYVYGKS